MSRVYVDETMSVVDLLNTIKRKYSNLVYSENNDVVSFSVGDTVVSIDCKEKKYDAVNLNKPGRKNILDLNSKENYSCLMLLIKLLNKGYSISNIFLEKGFKVGHKPGYLDFYVSNKDIVYMIEVKKNNQIDKYTSCNYPDETKQLLSYAFQDKGTKVASYYTYDFESDKDDFYNISIDSTYRDTKDVDDFYDVWNQIFDREDYIDNLNVFEVPIKELKYAKLTEITVEDTKKIFSKFQNLLRVYSVSDKPNAFMKFINLMLCKIGDEVSEDTSYQVIDKNGNSHTILGLKCQYLPNVDTPETFNLRLNQLYQKGMDIYLNKKIIGYSETEIQQMARLGSATGIKDALNTLSLKYSNPFNFIEIYNEDTFYDNFFILKDMVQIIQNYKFKYDYKQQFLGDFFEEMLNTSLKQEAGQFFTPMPIVDFIMNSIPYKEHIKQKLLEREELAEAIPHVIDYACGAGHFLTSSMVRTQEAINELVNDTTIDFTRSQKKDLETYSDKNRQYFWVDELNVVGIEKDYRLAKTTKITTYLNGDGRATILNADGINKFDCSDYVNCKFLYEPNIKNAVNNPSHSVNRFDFVISNPPYSVQGFTKNLNKNGIEIDDGTFSLYDDKYTEKDTRIENLFVERAWQLLKNNGIAALILPQSVLTSDKYTDVRNFVYKYFKIIGLTLTSDITFSGTSTSPVILFLKKLENINTNMNLDYETVIISSPKYTNPKIVKVSDKEKKFLGYEFSSNKNNSGIKLLQNSILGELSKYIKASFLGEDINIDKAHTDFVKVVKISDISILDDLGNKMVYPKYNKSNNGLPLNHYCSINSREENEFVGVTLKYLEIGDISKGEVKLLNDKTKKTTRYAKKGDILLSSLCPTADKIAIADDNYMVSTAIHVLSVKSGYKVEDILARLREDRVLEQMNSLLDGFKSTYAKISESNLSNYIKL